MKKKASVELSVTMSSKGVNPQTLTSLVKKKFQEKGKIRIPCQEKDGQEIKLDKELKDYMPIIRLNPE